MKSSTGFANTAAAKAEATRLISNGRSFGGARFFEFHDQSWFPESLRDSVTDALQFILSLGGIYRPIVPLLSKAIEAAGAQRVVDLCSGGSGPWLWLHRLLREKSGRAIEVCLTDKFPNIPAFENVNRSADGQVTFFAEPVDAANLPPDLAGFRTIFTSFHHFRPDEAVAILQNAVDDAQGIGVFEAARRHPLTILLTLLMPLGGFLSAPFIRPFRFSRLFWTYVIPVIPFVLYFDGVASCLRAYSTRELHKLIAQVKSHREYVWQVGEAPGLAPVTFLIGYPRQNDRGGEPEQSRNSVSASLER